MIDEGGILGEREGGVFKGEEGVGKMVKGLADTVGIRQGEKDVVASVMVDGRG